jgi:Domain of unknown function (DUF4158)
MRRWWSISCCPADLSLVFACRGHVNRCGMALLLKTLPYRGYVPESLDRIPPEVHTFVAAQLGLLWDHSKHYAWNSRTGDQHLFLIRQHTGWRPPSQHAAYEGQTTEYLSEAASQQLRQLRVELPAEGELHRLVNAALSAFFQDVHQRTAESVVASVRQRIDQLLIVPEAAPSSMFERLKSDPGKAGVDNFQAEIEKLKLIRSVDLAGEPFTRLPWNVLQVMKRRAMNETSKGFCTMRNRLCPCLDGRSDTARPELDSCLKTLRKPKRYVEEIFVRFQSGRWLGGAASSGVR